MLDRMPYFVNGRRGYDPFREMENLEKAFFGGDRRAPFAADIRDTGSAFLIEADLPGFKKEDIHVDLDGDMLTVSAERHSDYEDKEKAASYLHLERAYGKCKRAFDVSAVDTASITAAYENGVLTLTLPKKSAAAPSARRLEIQ